MIKYYAFTEKGNEKKTNDDKIMVDDRIVEKGKCSGSKEKMLVSIVCDGVGSTAYGARAAEIVADSFISYNAEDLSTNLLEKHINLVNQKIIEEQEQKKEGYCMASTVAGLIIYEDNFLSFNLGDTRIYELTSGYLSRLSFDHTVKSETNFLFSSNTSKKDALTRYMGGEGMTCYPYYYGGKINNESLFLICSDGIYKSLSERDIREVLMSSNTLKEMADILFQQACEGGSSDDKSIVLIDCSEKEKVD